MKCCPHWVGAIIWRRFVGELGRPPKDQGQGNELNPDGVPTQLPGALVAERAERLMSTFPFRVILECFYSFVGEIWKKNKK